MPPHFSKRSLLLLLVMFAGKPARAQETLTVTAHLLGLPRGPQSQSPATVAWLNPVNSAAINLPRPEPRTYRLLQKHRSFTPHLLVVPVGSSVAFPNEDPFFHNVFSLFDGKRFDLGLYEAGSSKSVVFGREGVSYIFCNIHPEMSAVVVSLNTPLHATATSDGSIRIPRVPPGEYTLNVWVEGAKPSALSQFTRRVMVRSEATDLGTLRLASGSFEQAGHTNKFGKPYDKPAHPSY